MRKISKILIVLLIVIFVLPIVSYIGIVVMNNSIAEKIEKDFHKNENIEKLARDIAGHEKLFLQKFVLIL